MWCGNVIFVVTIGYICADKKVVQFVPEKKAQIVPFFVRCAEDSNVSPEVVNQYKNGIYSSNDEHFQAFVYCVYTKTGYADKNGTVNIDKALDLFPKDLDINSIRNVMEECKEDNGEDPKQIVLKFSKCFRDNIPYIIKF